jgi:ATP-binding cassette subfamily B protein
MVWGDLYSNVIEKIIRKTNELTLEQLEDPTYDVPERARQRSFGRVNLMSDALSQVLGVS